MTERIKSAYVDYQKGMSRKDIASKYGVSYKTVCRWVSRYFTSVTPVIKKPKKKKVGAPPQNRNAVVTGEHETIWADQLSDDEIALFESLNLDPLAQINMDIRLLTIRERRMLSYLQELREKREIKEYNRHYALQDVDTVENMDGKSVIIPESSMRLIEYEESEKILMDKIIRIEEALTRVQDSKIKAITKKHEMISEWSADKKEPVIIIDDIRKVKKGEKA